VRERGGKIGRDKEREGEKKKQKKTINIFCKDFQLNE